MISTTSQEFESYVPVYDEIPEDWEEARGILLEYLKKMSNAINVREIGFWLDEELLSGKQFYPGQGANPNLFRTILRKVVDCSPLVAGVNNFPHGITFDGNFTLIQMFGAVTKHTAPYRAQPIPNGLDNIAIDATNIIITVGTNWDLCPVTIEYVQEL